MANSLNDSSNMRHLYERLPTPYLFVDKQKFLHNLKRLSTKLKDLKVPLRPHFKTIRCLQSLPYLLADKQSPITVSTLKEAEALVEAGYCNIVYAVGIVKAKLPRIKALNEQGADVVVVLDSIEQALQVTEFCQSEKCAISVLIEVDCDGHRGGVEPDDPLLLSIGRQLSESHAQLRGVLSHAGESYHCRTESELQHAANSEVNVTLKAVENLAHIGIKCTIVSIGSTPTAHHFSDLSGITEVRAGVYAFFDLVMAGIGICTPNDIAASVVTTVIGHNKEKGWLIIDAGWTALSSDRGTASQEKDCGYGLVKDNKNQINPNLCVTDANQEHGIIQIPQNCDVHLGDFPIGTRIQILPNHACATASMHQQYQVFDLNKQTHETWQRIQGW